VKQVRVKVRVTAAAVLMTLAAACTAQHTPVSMPGSVVNKGAADETAQGATPSVTIKAGDDWFSPTFVKAAPGARVTVEVDDVGDVAHTFTIDGQHVDVVLGRKGQTQTVTVTMPAGGAPVIFYCKYHQEVGMQGALYSR
jgi:plastocyanin